MIICMKRKFFTDIVIHALDRPEISKKIVKNFSDFLMILAYLNYLRHN
jgi:hypothetical protein